MNQLKINEIFASINGESTYIGLPFVFVRTSGCPLRCSWCDTRYAYDEGEDKSISDILREVEEFSIPNVLLTGGEPLLQPASLELMSQLLERDYQVVLETGGALNIADVPGGVAVVMDLKCPSSGMSERMHWGQHRAPDPRRPNQIRARRCKRLRVRQKPDDALQAGGTLSGAFSTGIWFIESGNTGSLDSCGSPRRALLDSTAQSHLATGTTRSVEIFL